jgi:purine catabolism regulator
MAVVTLAEVLAMPVLRNAGPEVLAGRAGLDRDVRWVHSAELADIAPLLRGGDLLLSTGIALPGSDAELQTFATSLADSDAAGLVIELGRRWQAVPDALVGACEAVELPLVALAREVPFAAVAQAVGERIVDEQLEELRQAQRVHDTFTELSIAEASPREILEAVQRLSGVAVVLEGEDHQVVDYRSGPGDISDFLAEWTARSRAVRLDGRTAWDARQGWLVTRLGRRERGWGRLVVQAPAEPSPRLVAVAERAAAALALHRLHDRHRDSLVRQTHHELVLGLLNDPTNAETLRRVELAGLPTERRQFVGLTARPVVTAHSPAGPPASLLEDLVAATVRTAHDVRVPALVCEIDRDVRVLLSFAKSANATKGTDEFAKRLRRRQQAIVGAGRTVDAITRADRSLRESSHIVASVQADEATVDVHRLEDVHLRGLLTLLGSDERVTLFVQRELQPLREHDARWGTALLPAVKALLEHPGSKSDAAASLHMSRPVFYDRLAKIERLLGVDLDDPHIRVSLHVALIADEVAPSVSS